MADPSPESVPLPRVAVVVLAALALRGAYLGIVAAAAPGGAAWLARQYDAPAYMDIATSFPVFQSTPELAATARWYPFSPLLIRLVALVASIDVAAFVVPMLASSMAVGLLYALARRFGVPHAGLVAAWFAVLPPKWFLLSVFPMSEAVYVALAIGAAHCALAGRMRWFAALLVLTVLTKATAVLFVAIFALWFGRRQLGRAAWTIAALAAPLALQLYLAAFHGFDRFPLFLHAQSGYQTVEYSTPTGQAFSWPLRAMIEGATDASIPLGFRGVVVAEFAAYALGVALAWRLRKTSDAMRLAFLWLAAFFAFHACVYGSLHLVGFRGYTRLMIPAAPALLVVYATAFRTALERPWLAAATAIAGAAGSLAITWATVGGLLV